MGPVQCIGEAFSVDTSDEAQAAQLSVKPANLLQIFDVYLKTEAKRGGSGKGAGAAASSSSSSSTPAPAAEVGLNYHSPPSLDTVAHTCCMVKASTSKASPAPASKADRAAAEKLKAEGNALMSSRNYTAALAKYTEAIAKDSSNPVYYSNRAAAYSQAGDHLKAIDDAEKAKEIDENYSKAYSRLG